MGSLKTDISKIISNEILPRNLILKTISAIEQQKTNLLPLHDLTAHLIISIENQIQKSTQNSALNSGKILTQKALC